MLLEIYELLFYYIYIFIIILEGQIDIPQRNDNLFY